ncbi:hypothetical protein D3C76_112650 [compost metagenome]
MSENHTLGKVAVRAGEILTFTFDDADAKHRHLTVVAIADIDLSREMALFCERTDRSGKDIFTENALPQFIQHLAEKRLLHVGKEVSVQFGDRGRPAARLMNEYRFRLNPESYWEDKLVHRYMSSSFTLFNHQHHSLTIMMGLDAPFYILADLLDMQGDFLGVLRLSIIPDHRHTFISDEDIERIRLALQADIAMNVEEISVMVERVRVASNREFGQNLFKRHLPPIPTPITEPESTPQ